MKKQISYPSFTTRIMTLVLDVVLASILWFIAMTIMIPLLGMILINQSLLLGPPGEQTMSALMLAPAAVMALYVILCWLTWGRTPAKILFNHKIVDATTLERPSKFKMIIRAVPLLIFFISMPFILLNKRGRTLHDLIAGTVVIKG